MIVSDTPFVGRDRELTQLHTFLTRALAGQGQICFVMGDAGAGKTRLMDEFVRQAQAQYQELVSAVGFCDPQTGPGDAYLLFREIMELLVGNTQDKVEQGRTSAENAQRLKTLLEASGDYLMNYGPDVISLFVPGGKLVGELVKGLVITSRKFLGGTESPTDKVTFENIDQKQIFEQYTNVLKGLATQAPLLLLLDDLQWADASSLELLFHLMRRIGDSRILLVGAYRPADVAYGRGNARHPLEKVLPELKRYHGDIVIDLDQARREAGVDFINALLDTEPNVLDATFRQTFYQRTDGHPLFAVELWRNLQERGDLIKDAQGGWCEAASLDWSALPARAEGVIEERLNRLEQDLLRQLKLASVQGENFAAEVIAQIEKVDIRPLVRQLSEELEQRHRLVANLGLQRIGEQRISRYQFQNRLFQQYLYANLPPTELDYLHEAIGQALEALYGDQADEIAVQLAWHFEQAQVQDKARYYLRRAGEQATARSAPVEALDYFTRALMLTPLADTTARFELLLAREQVLAWQGERAAQAQDLAELDSLAQTPGNPTWRAEVALRRAGYAEATGDYPVALQAAQSAIQVAQSLPDQARVAQGYLVWGRILWRQGDYDAAKTQLQRASETAHEIEWFNVEATSLLNLGNTFLDQGEHPQARTYYGQALRVYRVLGDRRGETMAINNLGTIALEQGNYSEAQVCYREALDLCQKTGNRLTELEVINNLGFTCQCLGDYTQARACYEQGIALCRQTGNRQAESFILDNLSLVTRLQGDHPAALTYNRQALALTEEIGNRSVHGWALTKGGHILVSLGELERAGAAYEAASVLQNELGQRHYAMEAVAGLAGVCLARGERDMARQHVDEVLAYLDEGGRLDGAEEPFLIYLTCYQVLTANHDPRANTFLNTAYARLRARAANITDDTLRHSFLINVPYHRELVRLCDPTAPELTVAKQLDVPAPPPTVSAAAPSVVPPLVAEPAAATVPPSAAPAPPQRPRLSLSRLWTWARWGLAAVCLLGIAFLIGQRAVNWPHVAPRLFSQCPPDCVGADLTGQDLRTVDLAGVDLSGADLSGANLIQSHLENSTLTAAHLNQARLMVANLHGAHLGGSNLVAADLRGANLTQADLGGAILLGADLRRADLRGASLTGATLSGVNLAGANLCGTDLRGAILGTDLSVTVTLTRSLPYHPSVFYGIDPDSVAGLSIGAPNFNGAFYNQYTLWSQDIPPGAIAVDADN